MSDLISRQALAEKKFPLVECKGMGEGAAYRQGWNDAIDAIIENEPSADAIEVVRCKDCKHYFTSDLEMAKNHGAECVIRPRRMMPEDYCSYGAKKDG